MKTVYVLNYINTAHDLFYDIHAGFDERRRFTVYLREEIEKAGYRFMPIHDCENLDKSGFILSLRDVANASDIANIANHSRERCVLFNVEPWHLSTVNHLYSDKIREIFGSIFLLFDDWVDNINYFKTYHPQAREERVKNIPSFDQKKLCVMIQTRYSDANSVSPHHSLYDKRIEAAEFFAQTGELDLYGRFWEGNPAWRAPHNLMIKDKLPLLQHYKFCLCYENMRNQCGYITERIFECFYGGVCPIYWGATNITDYIPKECFIDRRQFSSNQELLSYMKSMTSKEYDEYIQAGIEFIESPQAQPFSARNVARSLVNRIQIIDKD